MGTVVIDVLHIFANVAELNGWINTMRFPSKENSKDTQEDKDPEARISNKFLQLPFEHSINHSVDLDQQTSTSQKPPIDTMTYDRDSCESVGPLLSKDPEHTKDKLSETGPDFDTKLSWSVNMLWYRFINQRRHKPVEVGEGKFVYIVMENLTHGLKRPHILDLKMGIQQHGMDESSAKIISKVERVQKTTSASLGARVAGMQVYDEVENRFILRDKYWGRSLDNVGLEGAVRMFVFSQRQGCVNRKIVTNIILQLECLKIAVEAACWRFYGCSLLVVYDGASTNDLENEMCGIQSEGSVISRTRGLSFSEKPMNMERMDSIEVPDSPYASNGMKKFSSACQVKNLNDDCEKNYPSEMKSAQISNRSRSFSVKDDSYESFDHRNCVTVKLIDFSKTERLKNCHSYDTGLTFGIKNLILILKKMLLE